MKFREFIKNLHEADGVGQLSPAKVNALNIEFHMGLEGAVYSTSSILSLYVDEETNTLHIDIGDDI